MKASTFHKTPVTTNESRLKRPLFLRIKRHKLAHWPSGYGNGPFPALSCWTHLHGDSIQGNTLMIGAPLHLIPICLPVVSFFSTDWKKKLHYELESIFVLMDMEFGRDKGLLFVALAFSTLQEIYAGGVHYFLYKTLELRRCSSKWPANSTCALPRPRAFT